jgi:hypothetical protein
VSEPAPRSLGFEQIVRIDADPGWRAKVQVLRSKYPFVSLADRMQDEKKRRVQNQEAGTEPAMPQATVERLDHFEQALDFVQSRAHFQNVARGRTDSTLRTRALESLHSEQVSRFIVSDGFGMSRMVSTVQVDEAVELPPAERIPFDYFSDTDSEAQKQEKLSLAERRQLDPQADRHWPTGQAAQLFHRSSAVDFLHPETYGFARSRLLVAGFEPHRFTKMPDLNPPPSKGAPESSRWLLRRLELVSLLKHEQDVVYISEFLPRMDDLQKAKTRPLNAFEAKALTALRKGEDLVSETTFNQIHLLGALRATKQCLQCHEARRGELLGAFTYQLQRETPMPAIKSR